MTRDLGLLEKCVIFVLKMSFTVGLSGRNYYYITKLQNSLLNRDNSLH